ncbi:MAG TPA: glycosyltransferase family 4 protein, partial [Vicinamibacteria bacterium]|nr:glycosyltransferase family 4 protein [Vicinamibacteria bacterium]
GHEVHAVLRRTAGSLPREEREGVTLHRVRWVPPHRLFRFRALPSVLRILDDVGPAALIERYYNFGGEGIRAARRRGVPSLLEVNSPILDHPGSWKSRLDALALVHPFRTYRESLCRQATALVSPTLEIVPSFAREKTERVSWGANVDSFHPRFRNEALRERLGVPKPAVVVLFSGSFRPWHGVHVLEKAAELLRERHDLFFLFVGGERAGEGHGFNGRFLGSVPYESMPEIVASCDIGVAPYDTARLGQLRLGFYWSPLKIFEYMASGLPTLTIAAAPLNEIVREGLEGFHVREASPRDLARGIERLAADPGLRAEMGRSGRERVVAHYSWAHHCAQLEGVLRRICR